MSVWKKGDFAYMKGTRGCWMFGQVEGEVRLWHARVPCYIKNTAQGGRITAEGVASNRGRSVDFQTPKGVFHRRHLDEVNDRRNVRLEHFNDELSKATTFFETEQQRELPLARHSNLSQYFANVVPQWVDRLERLGFDPQSQYRSHRNLDDWNMAVERCRGDIKFSSPGRGRVLAAMMLPILQELGFLSSAEALYFEPLSSLASIREISQFVEAKDTRIYSWNDYVESTEQQATLAITAYGERMMFSSHGRSMVLSPWDRHGFGAAMPVTLPPL